MPARTLPHDRSQWANFNDTTMLGIRFIKVPPTVYLMQFRAGRAVREGAGLSFFYYAPTTSLVAIPIGSTDAPFIFQEVTADFQEVTIQGQVSYRIGDPKKVASLLNFTLDATGSRYSSDDPTKLPQRVINTINVLARKQLSALSLRDATRASEAIVAEVRANLGAAPEIVAMGLEILGLSILAIKPTPETARALEAGAREQLLKEADDATYARRNAAVEQERGIKENELNTEIAVENKKRQIREAQMEAERSVQEKQHELEQAAMAARVKIEEKNKELVALTVENARAEAEARAHGVSVVMKALEGADPRTLQALANAGMKPEQLIATAFQGIAEKAGQIGTLNISPDLLRELLHPADRE